ncbi:HlyD family secretion protein (plasmid) [Cetobacterium somerae]|uniref:HlyD family secretion protein n=1 Tax=Cetobacterium somerae TaxID=188913 RepID=UPI002E7BB4BD|nr:HlyD family secretion protein [Cetobacterium somerae]WVJ02494.1 HlyD family secretion protein [Cetobacterium somerae]
MDNQTTNQNIVTDETKNKNRKDAKKKMGIFLLIILIIGVLYLLYYFFFLKGYEETENAYIHGNQVSITTQVSGVINEINVEDTQSIDVGTPVIKLDTIDYEIALKNAETKLADAVRKYYTLQNSVKLNEDSVAIAKANLTLADKTLKRQTISSSTGITSKENFDTTNFKYIDSKNSYEQSLTNLENSKIQAFSNDIYSHPLVAAAIENFKNAYYNLEKTKIFSPISGVIAQKQVELGQQVKAGQTLFTVVDLNKTWVNANFKETQLGDIKPGNYVEIVSDLNGKTYKGVVSGISAGSGSAFALIPTQNATGNWIKIVQRVPVRIDFDQESLEKNGILPIGTSLTVTVNTNKNVDIPNQFKEQKSELYKIDENKLSVLIEKIVKDNSF